MGDHSTQSSARPPLAFRGPAARAAAVLLALSAVAAAVVSSRWAVAETAVDHIGDPAVLRDSAEWAPGNPAVYHALGIAALDRAPADPAAAVELLRQAAERGPNRYRVWIEYGRALERERRDDEAAGAFARAAALAPTHWEPSWMLGNLLVRHGRLAEAVGHLRHATLVRPWYSTMVVRTIWLGSGRDFEFTVRSGEGMPILESGVVDAMLRDGRVDQASDAWLRYAGPPELGELEPGLAESGRGVAAALLETGLAARAAALFGRLAPGHEATPERLTDGGFEREVSEAPVTPFEWAVPPHPDARAAIDAGRSGKALRVSYAAKGGASIVSATQTVLLTPGASYELRAWVRADGLVSGATPILRVDGATKPAPALAASQPLPTGSFDWREVRLHFRAPAGGAAVVSLVRPSCGEVCPIFGSLWIDDLSLVRVQ